MKLTRTLLLAAMAVMVAGCPPDEVEEPAPLPDPVVSCGSWGLGGCGQGEYCRYETSATCGWADAPGTCEPMPELCTMIYAPVCGCDGATYSSECSAAGQGVSVLHSGECACEDGIAATPSADEVPGHYEGGISWAVEWTFYADGSFVKSDLIAPCPADVMCVWSGIVTNTGTWSVSGATVTLAYTSPTNSAGATTPGALSALEDCAAGGISLQETYGDGTTVVYAVQ